MDRHKGWAGRPCIISVDPASAVAGDYSAIGVLSFAGIWFEETAQPVCEISHLERAQKVKQSEIIVRLREIVRWLEDEKHIPPPVVLIDANGIGRGVHELAVTSFPENVVLAFVATGSQDGLSDRFDQALMTIYASKLQHLSGLNAAAEAGRLIIPANLKHGGTLQSEARSLSTKISKSGRILVDEPNSQISQFDDILNSVSMAVHASDLVWTKSNIAKMRDHWSDRMSTTVEVPI